MDLHAQFFRPVLSDRTSVNRNIQPSPEKLKATSSVLISPKKTPTSNQLEGSPLKRRIESSPTNKNYKSVDVALQTVPQQLLQEFKNLRHIVFEWTLWDATKEELLPFTPEQGQMLAKLFPKTRSVFMRPPFLVIKVEQLPPRPWPLTVAGAPLFVCTEDPHFGQTGLDGRHWRNQDITSIPLLERLSRARDYLVSEKALPISSITYFGVGNTFHIVLREACDRHLLPGMLSTAPCLYRLKSQEVPVFDAAMRAQQPTSVSPDDSNYLPGGTGTLRPGVLVCCNRPATGLADRMSSSGVSVCLKNDPQKRFLTVASHTIPIGNEHVWHPKVTLQGPSTRIATLHAIMAYTDITLVKLASNNIRYVNETFGSRAQGVDGIRISGIVGSNEYRLNDVLFWNSPFSGYTECSFLGVRVDLGVSGDARTGEPPILPSDWIEFNEIQPSVVGYVGNGLGDSMEGTCGVPIASQDGKLYGFFRFLQHDGLAYGPWAGILDKAGYRLSDI